MSFKGFLKKFSNKYVIATLIFAAVIVFIDQNNIFEQGRTVRKMRKGEQELEKLTRATQEKWQESYRLKNDTDYMEKVAREQYFTKRDNEDVYIME